MARGENKDPTASKGTTGRIAARIRTRTIAGELPTARNPVSVDIEETEFAPSPVDYAALPKRWQQLIARADAAIAKFSREDQEQTLRESAMPTGLPRPWVDELPLPYSSAFEDHGVIDPRRAQRSGKCDVCGDSIKTCAAFFWTIDGWDAFNGQRLIPANGKLSGALVDWVLHLRCARLAATYCPHLRGEGETVHTTTARVELWLADLTAVGASVDLLATSLQKMSEKGHEKPVGPHSTKLRKVQAVAERIVRDEAFDR